MSTQRCGRCKQEVPIGSYSPAHQGRVGTWCKTCAAAYARGELALMVEHKPRACEVCGRQYVPKQLKNAAAYCSRECKDIARNAKRAAETLAAKPERECLHCAQKLRPGARTDAIFCSAKCNSDAHSLQRKLRARTGQEDKPGYLRAEVCERDGWWCGLCDTWVNPLLEHPDPMCASLDHVVPVSRSGDNRLSNLQLAHLVCNLRRRNLDVDTYLAKVSA